MKNVSETIVEAVKAPALPGQRIPDARSIVPNRTRLYAVHASPATERTLELEER